MATIGFTTAPGSSVKCKKCQKYYDDPRMLPCLHSFCKSCVGQLVIQTGSKKTVRCPKCYSTTPLPLKGVEVFPRNVRLSYEATISKYEAQIKSEPPPSCDECRREPPLETVSFCCTCRGFLCKECHEQHTLSRKTWVFHQFVVLKDVKKKNVQTELQNIMKVPGGVKCVVHAENELKFHCKTCNALVCLECTVVTHQGHKFEEVGTFLTQQKKSLLEENTIETLTNNVHRLEEVIQIGKDTREKIQTSKQSVDKEIEEAFGKLENALRERKNKLLNKCKEISTAKETSLTIQLEELISLKDQMVACTGVVAEVQESYNDTELLSVVTTLQTRVQELTQQFDKMPLDLREDGSMSLAIDATVLGNEIPTLGTILDHQPRDYKTLKDPLITISFNSPTHLGVHENGDIFVTNHNNHFIRVFNCKRKIGNQGTNNGQFSHPTGITVVGDVLFVSDFSGKRVQKMTTGGEFLSKFGTNEALSGPHGNTVGLDGMIYVADQIDSSVKVFNPDGSLSHTIGQGQLNGARDVAIDNDRNIHVASLNLKHIKVFTPRGELVREYGREHLQGPSGVAVDRDGYCLVGDQYGKSLVIFDPRGKLVHSIKFAGNICGVTLDKGGFVYVAERSSNKVHKY